VIYKKGNRLQYLCGIYKKSCLPALNISLISKELKVQELINKIDAEILDADMFSEEIFFNLNNKEDYESLIKMNLSF
jgi:molybdopterin-guanine dinucleotide biosynthesis protein A